MRCGPRTTSSSQVGDESGHRERALRGPVSDFEGGHLLDTALGAQSQRPQAEQIIHMTLQVVRHLRSQCGRLEVSGEHKLITLTQDPARIRYWPPEIASDEVKSQVVAQVVDAAGLPSCVGVVLSGSVASEHKRDAFSDLDIVCLCTEPPNDAVHAAIAESLMPDNRGAFGDHVTSLTHCTRMRTPTAAAASGSMTAAFGS